jgi:hypothetical protein
VPPFLPGVELARVFYEEAVRPLLAEAFPTLAYSAARVGSGSEVLGYDTERSADHEWGPRLQLFLRPDDVDRLGRRITDLLSERLPRTVRGWSTNFGPQHADIRSMEATDGPVRHRVEVVSTAGWCLDRLGFEPLAGVTTFDWLATPAQRLAETVGGSVFHDGLEEVSPLRRRLAWYPPAVHRYLLACQWQRIAQEEAFPGRCEEVGDELGARVLVGRLVVDLMRLSLLMDRRYPPYGKWLGSAFSSSPSGARLAPTLHGACSAATWPERESHLAHAYRLLAAQHNASGLTPPLDESPRRYYDRPYLVIDATRFAEALQSTLVGTELASLAPIGAIDQFVDSTDVLTRPPLARSVTAAAHPLIAPGLTP